MKFVKIFLLILVPLPIYFIGRFFLIRMKSKKIESEKGFNWKNFSLDEIDTTKNGATDEQLKNADFAITNMLQPHRDLYGKPMHVNSGIRDYIPEGGSLTSHHKQGFAFDVEAWNYLNSENIEMAKILANSDIPFTQLIIEFGGAWVHEAYNGNNKREIKVSFGDRKKPSYKQISLQELNNM
jgi:hypothetical protein